MSKPLTLKSRVYAFYNLYKANGKPFIWRHFKEEGEARSTIYRLMKHAQKGKNVTRKKEVDVSRNLTHQVNVLN